MADINEKRAYVENLYDGPRWKNRVRHMSDIQVTAIYLKEKKAEAEKPKPKKENDDEIPF